jgi:hypothetical protein
MNEFSELEEQLRKLRPLAPSEDLIARIERALTKPANYRSSASAAVDVGPRWRWPWHFIESPYGISLGFGLAAVAALLIFARFELKSPKQEIGTVALRAPASVVPSRDSSAEFVPADLTQIVYNTRDEGLLFLAGSDQPLRRVRSQTRETLQWRNPKTGASLRVSYPSDEISFIPVSGE